RVALRTLITVTVAHVPVEAEAAAVIRPIMPRSTR
ncbi:unnamed protein product, partial [marine sediment metagenome]